MGSAALALMTAARTLGLGLGLRTRPPRAVPLPGDPNRRHLPYPDVGLLELVRLEVSADEFHVAGLVVAPDPAAQRLPPVRAGLEKDVAALPRFEPHCQPGRGIRSQDCRPGRLSELTVMC